MTLRERIQSALGSAYTIERELGGGGMSRVFVAEETAFGRKVVIKVLPPELAAELSAERFAREVRLAAQLQHPQIVPVLAAGDADGIPYYTMPLVEGESLRTQLAQAGPLPIARAVSVLRDVAKALEFAHSRGVVHRDIKPDNVLLAGSSAAVTDFGIAKALSASKAELAAPNATLTQMGTSIGTPSYMAPEQAVGDPDTDHRADIYAFGCMAYELLSGSTPFGDKPTHLQIVAHFSERPVPIDQRRADVPAGLARLIMRCLEKNPADRPQTATEILAELDASPTGSAIASGTRSRIRARSLIAAALGVVVAAAATIVFMTRKPASAVDNPVIAVLPFRVAGADPSLQYLREGMLDLLSAKLTSGGIRAVDSRTLLAAWRKAGGDEKSDIPDDASRRLAARVGAGQVLVGDVVGTGKQVTIHATLVNAATGKHTDASVIGAVDTLPALVDRLAAELLTRRAGEGEQRLAGLTSTSLPALRAYLDGQANYRRGRWPAASASFNTALDADSNFALAALGVLQTAPWFGQTRELGRAHLTAQRMRARFAPRDLALLAVLVGPNYPKYPTLAERAVAAERYTTLAPDSPDAWYHLGDWYFHFGAGSGIEDATRRSLTALSHAIELDSTFMPALEHLPMLYAATGDSAKLRQSIGLLTAQDSGNAIAGERMVAFAELGDSAEVQRLRALIPRMSPTALSQIVLSGRAGRVGLDDANRAAAAMLAVAVTPFDQGQAHTMAMMLESDLGHVAKAVQEAERATGNWKEALLALGAVFWDWDSTGTAAAVKAMEREIATMATGTPSQRRRAEGGLAAVAQYFAWRGDSSGVSRIAEQLRRINFPGDSLGLTAEQERFQLVVDAQLATMTQRPTARALLTRLDSVAKSDPQSQVGLYGNLVAMRGWELLGDIPLARAALRRTVGDGAPPMFYTTLLRENGRLAAIAGDRESAIRAYRQYLVLRADPDPGLKPQADRVRAELQRLEAQRAR